MNNEQEKLLNQLSEYKICFDKKTEDLILIRSENAQSRVIDEEKSIEELLIEELENVIEWFEEAGNNEYDVKGLVYNRIEELKNSNL